MTRKPTGRVTARKGVVAAGQPGRTTRWEVQESRSVRSGWVWRGFLMLTLLAVGVALVMAGNHQSTLAALWGVIAVGWLATSMWLWRQHTRYIRTD
ncbi:MAG: hypothetical protein M0Z30_13530 [Actinomycetota bacterium]|nr:hypothetical protein [Actinomycetota bacterium]